ncbi:MAG: AI-2E family transporter [Candidatus Krumholzibacteriota bacterium]
MPTTTASKAFLLLLVGAITLTFLSMIKPFIMAVLLAGIFSSLAQPVYHRVTGWFKGRRSAASIVTLLMIVLVIILPLGLLLGIVTGEAIKVGESISPWVQDKINNPDKVIVWMQGLPYYDRIAPYEDDILTRAGQMVGVLSKFLINNLSHATTGTVHFLFMLMIMLYSMYFFLMDGGKLIDLILYYLPLEDQEERRLLDKFSSVTRATLKGTAVIGILQGGLAGAAFAVVGIPSAVFWGTLMVVLSVIPGIGTGLIWVPAAAILIAGGHMAKGVGLAIFCGLVVGSIDNVVRPRLVGKDTQMPDLLILLGTMGGIMMFGVLGLILGPIVAALFVTIWEIYGVVFRDVLPPGRATSGESVGGDPDGSG